ncbi:MAG: hypothetical protein LBL46_01285 [Rickettsiales bacterium]|jgi:DNA polymerase-1|nr:hypothetical protein [Rickettsiales bacterium]
MRSIIDGNSLLFRAFYGVHQRLTRPDGTPTNAVYGMCNMILPLIAAAAPADEFICVFDAHRKNWRNDIYPEYKANRDATPADLVAQIEIARGAIRAMGMPCLVVPDVEADDVIATLCQEECPTRIISSDKDLAQLVNDCVFIFDTMKDAEMRAPEVLEKFGARPNQMVDYQALVGDASDNVPGVKGIGPKKAAELLARFGTLDAIYENLDAVEGRAHQLLTDGREMAMMSRTLVRLRTDVPIPPFEKYRFDGARAAEFFMTEVGSSTLAEKARKLGFPAPARGGGTDFVSERGSQTRASLTKSWVGGHLGKQNYSEAQGANLPPPKNIHEKLQSNFSGSSIPPPQAGAGNAHELFPDAPQAAPVAPEGIAIFDADNIDMEKLRDPKLIKLSYDWKTLFHKLGTDEIENAVDVGLMNYAINRRAENIVDDYQFYTAHPNPRIYEMDRAILRPLFRMENNGVLVDIAKLKEISDLLHRRANDLKARIWELASEEFNVASPKQLGVILFDKLGLPSGKKRSTDADVLAELAPDYEIVRLVLDWRTAAKLTGTYTDALPRAIGPDGRIHTTFLQTSTNTGRLSSRDPNLQNIPIKSEVGAEIRKCFIAPAGSKLIAADYSQIQLRLLAHLSGAAVLKEAFANGRDIHSETAKKIFGAMTPENRRMAKTINFSIIYGVSPFGLAAQIGCSQREAADIIENYMAALPEVRGYMEATKKEALARGFVETPFGRRIWFPEINNPRMRGYALRAAVNAPIQGFEADIMRVALARLAELPVKMILQIHDEIVFEAPEGEAEKYALEIKKIMESVVSLSVPLAADFSISDRWEK